MKNLEIIALVFMNSVEDMKKSRGSRPWILKTGETQVLGPGLLTTMNSTSGGAHGKNF